MPPQFSPFVCVISVLTINLSLHKDQPISDSDANNNGVDGYDVCGDFKVMGRKILSFRMHLQWRKRNGSHFATSLANQIERSLMR
jgi:hypothetical protein